VLTAFPVWLRRHPKRALRVEMGVDREATVFQTFGDPPAAASQPTTSASQPGQLTALS